MHCAIVGKKGEAGVLVEPDGKVKLSPSLQGDMKQRRLFSVSDCLGVVG